MIMTDQPSVGEITKIIAHFYDSFHYFPEVLGSHLNPKSCLPLIEKESSRRERQENKHIRKWEYLRL